MMDGKNTLKIIITSLLINVCLSVFLGASDIATEKLYYFWKQPTKVVVWTSASTDMLTAQFDGEKWHVKDNNNTLTTKIEPRIEKIVPEEYRKASPSKSLVEKFLYYLAEKKPGVDNKNKWIEYRTPDVHILLLSFSEVEAIMFFSSVNEKRSFRFTRQNKTGFWKKGLIPLNDILGTGEEEDFRKTFTGYIDGITEPAWNKFWKNLISGLKKKKIPNLLSFVSKTKEKKYMWVEGITHLEMLNNYLPIEAKTVYTRISIKERNVIAGVDTGDKKTREETGEKKKKKKENGGENTGEGGDSDWLAFGIALFVVLCLTGYLVFPKLKGRWAKRKNKKNRQDWKIVAARHEKEIKDYLDAFSKKSNLLLDGVNESNKLFSEYIESVNRFSGSAKEVELGRHLQFKCNELSDKFRQDPIDWLESILKNLENYREKENQSRKEKSNWEEEKKQFREKIEIIIIEMSTMVEGLEANGSVVTLLNGWKGIKDYIKNIKEKLNTHIDIIKEKDNAYDGLVSKIELLQGRSEKIGYLHSELMDGQMGLLQKFGKEQRGLEVTAIISFLLYYSLYHLDDAVITGQHTKEKLMTANIRRIADILRSTEKHDGKNYVGGFGKVVSALHPIDEERFKHLWGQSHPYDYFFREMLGRLKAIMKTDLIRYYFEYEKKDEENEKVYLAN